MDVHGPRQDEQSGRVDDLARRRRESAQVRFDRLDRPAADEQIRPGSLH
jgi:hypothetical protein